MFSGGHHLNLRRALIVVDACVNLISKASSLNARGKYLPLSRSCQVLIDHAVCKREKLSLSTINHSK